MADNWLADLADLDTTRWILMDRLEARGYKEGSMVEVAARRLRRSMDTALRHYVDLGTRRAQEAAREALEKPAVRVEDG